MFPENYLTFVRLSLEISLHLEESDEFAKFSRSLSISALALRLDTNHQCPAKQKIDDAFRE